MRDTEKLRKADEANEKLVSVSGRLARAKTITESVEIIGGEKSGNQILSGWKI